MKKKKPTAQAKSHCHMHSEAYCSKCDGTTCEICTCQPTKGAAEEKVGLFYDNNGNTYQVYCPDCATPLIKVIKGIFRCIPCSKLPPENIPVFVPMGISQWKNHGIAYGYWDFFVKQERKRIAQKITELRLRHTTMVIDYYEALDDVLEAINKDENE